MVWVHTPISWQQQSECAHRYLICSALCNTHVLQLQWAWLRLVKEYKFICSCNYSDCCLCYLPNYLTAGILSANNMFLKNADCSEWWDNRNVLQPALCLTACCYTESYNELLFSYLHNSRVALLPAGKAVPLQSLALH